MRGLWLGFLVAMVLGERGPASAASHAAHVAALDALPWPSRISLERAMSAHEIVATENGVPVLDAGGVRASIDDRGAALAIGDRHATLRALAIRRGDERRPLGAATPTIAGPEVRTDRDGVSEWWRALPSGLEHGVTIAARPAGEGALSIELGLDGALRPHTRSDDAIDLIDTSGTPIASYAHLVVFDAAGAVLPARMSSSAGQIAIELDDARARYPIMIDPLLVANQEWGLLGSDTTGSDAFGGSVSLSSDGSRALVGAPGHSLGTGVAYVFLRTGTSWAQEAELVASTAERTTASAPRSR